MTARSARVNPWERRRRAAAESAGKEDYHHHVYVVLLDAKAARLKALRAANPGRDPAKPCLYVGMSGLDPRQRFLNHKRGYKSARVVERYGIRLLPHLYECYNPMPFEAAARLERELAQDLRRAGYTVAGGT